ncbi:MAG TPA: hypothetical protein VM639_08155 [Dongiaceae bacterium]|nr:hypothetical protein [Dongiaceae bacterium]
MSDTGWKNEDIPPRHAPYFSKTMPIRKHWRWRSLVVQDTAGAAYVLLVRYNNMKGDWQAVLCRKFDDGTASIIGRFEYHEDHPGVHIHSHCDRSGVEIGAIGLDGLARIPRTGRVHRRKAAWTENSFLEAAKRFFRIEEKKGGLL